MPLLFFTIRAALLFSVDTRTYRNINLRRRQSITSLRRRKNNTALIGNWYFVKWPDAAHVLSRSCTRSYSKRVVDIPNVGFYSLPKIMGRTGRFIYDGLRLISLGCKQKQKNTNIVQKPNTALVAVGHFPLSPYRLPVGSSANKSLHWGYR